MRIRTPLPPCSPGAHLPLQPRSSWRACFGLATLALCLQPANAQIAKIIDDSRGRHFFVNSDPAPSRFAPNVSKFATTKPRATIFLPAESSFAGHSRPAMTIDRDGAERLVREAAERHHMDPALVRAVIETESGWNATAKSRKGALGLMQLIPTTADRKSTRLNSSHANISYAVFCLKKKKK